MATKRVFIARFAALMAVLSLLTGCNHKPQPAPLSDVAEPIASPGWINFRADATVKPGEFFARYADALQLAPGTEMRALAAETDELGITHHRYQQRFRDIDVEGAEFLLHAKGDKLLSANGRLAHRFAPATVAPAFDEARALAVVRERMQTDVFYAGTPLADALRDDRTTTTPRGELLFAAIGPQPQYVLAWRFDAYMAPVDRSLRLYVDAAVAARSSRRCHCCQTASRPMPRRRFAATRVSIQRAATFPDSAIGSCWSTTATATNCASSHSISPVARRRRFSTAITTGPIRTAGRSRRSGHSASPTIFSTWCTSARATTTRMANMVSINHPTLGNNATGGGGVITIGIAGHRQRR